MHNNSEFVRMWTCVITDRELQKLDDYQLYEILYLCGINWSSGMAKVLLELPFENPTRIRYFFTFTRTYGNLITINLPEANANKLIPQPPQRQIGNKRDNMTMDDSLRNKKVLHIENENFILIRSLEFD